MRQAWRAAAPGAVLGTVLIAGGGVVARSLRPAGTGLDPAAAVAGALAVAAAVALASWAPAARAMRVDPAVVLREQ